MLIQCVGQPSAASLAASSNSLGTGVVYAMANPSAPILNTSGQNSGHDSHPMHSSWSTSAIIMYPPQNCYSLLKGTIPNYFIIRLVSWKVSPITIRKPSPCGLGVHSIIAFSFNKPVSYTHLRAHETRHDLVCRLLLEKKKKKKHII